MLVFRRTAGIGTALEVADGALTGPLLPGSTLDVPELFDDIE